MSRPPCATNPFSADQAELSPVTGVAEASSAASTDVPCMSGAATNLPIVAHDYRHENVVISRSTGGAG